MTPPSAAGPGQTGDLSGSRDEVPAIVVRVHEWALRHWPRSTRRRVAIIVAIVALVVGSIAASARILGRIDGPLDLVAYVGLVVVCWIGAGGALVPIPGVRALSLVMVAHQGAALDPVTVAVVAALAMALGKSSYYVAARLGEGHLPGALQRQAVGVGAIGLPPRSGAAGTLAVTDETAGAATSASRGRMARTSDWVARVMRERPMRTIFLASMIPTPLATLTAASAGALGVGYRRFFFASLAGFLVLTTVFAVAGQLAALAGEAAT